jgi:hypothetical protein
MKSRVPHPGNVIRIQLPEETAIRAFFRVKPTADMPRPGANPKTKKPTKRKAK